MKKKRKKKEKQDLSKETQKAIESIKKRHSGVTVCESDFGFNQDPREMTILKGRLL